MKRNQGITLIALVITIIVLLILAGVAITMLSGENGILKKAVEAKTKTEEGQKEEETSLTTMDLETNFLTNNFKYKCKYGYITGIAEGENAENLKKILNNQGYKLRNIENTEDVADNTTLTTGMAVTKDDNIVARTVIFGDIKCDGEISNADRIILERYINKKVIFNQYNSDLKDYQKVACNIDDNSEMNGIDVEILARHLAKWVGYETINQNKTVSCYAKDIKRCYKILQSYIRSLDENTGYSFKYDEKTDTYVLSGVEKNTTVENLIKALPNSDQLKVLDKDGEEVANDQNVLDGYYIQRSFTEDEYDYKLDVASIELK